MWRETLLSDLRAAMSSDPRQQSIMWRSFQTTLVRVKRTSRREKWERIRQACFRYPTVIKLRLLTPIFNASTRQESIRASIIGHRAAIKCELNQWMNISSVTAHSLEIMRCRSKRVTTAKSWSVTATLMWTVLSTKINHFREHSSLSNLRGQPLKAMRLISGIRSRRLRSQGSSWASSTLIILLYHRSLHARSINQIDPRAPQGKSLWTIIDGRKTRGSIHRAQSPPHRVAAMRDLSHWIRCKKY